MTLEEALEKLNSGNCPSGLELNFYNNKIGDKGAQALAKALMSRMCPSGLRLDLETVGNIGAQAFAEALASGSCPSGLSLDLTRNEIADEGTQALARALKSANAHQIKS